MTLPKTLRRKPGRKPSHRRSRMVSVRSGEWPEVWNGIRRLVGWRLRKSLGDGDEEIMGDP